jgi:hypothetical protein
MLFIPGVRAGSSGSSHNERSGGYQKTKVTLLVTFTANRGYLQGMLCKDIGIFSAVITIVQYRCMCIFIMSVTPDIYMAEVKLTAKFTV